ncbi:MAG: hypothetical protein ACI9LN_000690 [Saprospiraceae bacterium]
MRKNILMKGMPPDFLQPILHSIEGTTIRIHTEFPTIVDNDVEWVYDRLLTYYKNRISNKNVEEPLSTVERRQILIDEILNIIDVREEREMDIQFINNPKFINIGNPIPSIEIFYTLAFKRLRNSVRTWRKKRGRKGYLSFIEPYL